MRYLPLMRNLSPDAVYAFNAELEKLAARGRIIGHALDRMKMPRAAKAVRSMGERSGEAISKALKYEIPGTRKIRIMPKKSAHQIADMIGDHPESFFIAAAAPFPGAMEGYVLGARALERKLLKPSTPKVKNKFRRELPKAAPKVPTVPVTAPAMKKLSQASVEGFWGELTKLSELDKERMFKILPAAGAALGAGLSLAKSKGKGAEKLLRAVEGAGIGATTGWLPQVGYEGAMALKGKKQRRRAAKAAPGA